MKFFLVIGWLGSTGFIHAGDLPRSNNPEEFQREVEAFTIARSESGNGLIDSYNPTAVEALKGDKRDWESTLARIIGNPERYGIGTSGVAFDAAIFRQTAKNPEIVAVTQRLLEARIQATEKSYEDYESQGKPKHPAISSELGGTIARVLKVGSAEHLLAVLDYFDSPIEAKLGRIHENTPNHVSAALRDYGDERHIEGAVRFAKKLREVGRAEIADDIDRSIDRIRNDASRNRAASTRGTDAENASGTDNSADNAPPLWPWLVAGVALIAALIAYFRLKRAGT